jgi:hypothetical protein
MNIESLDQAIKDFNGWEKGARIYFDTSDGTFNTEVFFNDVHMSHAFPADNFYGVFSKEEVKGHIKIGEKRKGYIVKYTNLILDGWSPIQAEYQLMDEFAWMWV